MNQLSIRLDDDRTAYAPGERIAGSVCWQADAPLAALDLRLFWFTRGKGTQDVGVVERLDLADPGASGERRFAFVAPAHPPSCSGTLISIAWALELVGEPAPLARTELVIARDGRELLLGG